MIRYTMIVERDGDGYSAHFPDLPGCFTQGDTLDDLYNNAVDAIDVHIQALRDTGHPIPEPTAFAMEVGVKAS